MVRETDEFPGVALHGLSRSDSKETSALGRKGTVG